MLHALWLRFCLLAKSVKIVSFTLHHTKGSMCAGILNNMENELLRDRRTVRYLRKGCGDAKVL